MCDLGLPLRQPGRVPRSSRRGAFMRRILNAAVGVAMALSTMLTLSTAASANPIAGGGYSSSYSGESAFTNVGAGQSGQMSAIFFNDGSQAWAPGVVGLLICAADKVTCNVPS